MDRRSFADILLEAEFDSVHEYYSLVELLHDEYKFERGSYYDLMRSYFDLMPFKGTAISLEDFNQRFGFIFSVDDDLAEVDFNKLLLLCEYILNFANNMVDIYGCAQESDFLIKHIEAICEKMSYQEVKEEGLSILVPRNDLINAAAECSPPEVSIDLITFDYWRYKGDLERKRLYLAKFARELESKRDLLSSLSNKVKDDFFFLVNSLNIRHDNLTEGTGNSFAPLRNMSDQELESWYDTLRNMAACLFLLLDYSEHIDSIKSLKRDR